MCDLSECEYLKQRGTIVKPDTNTAIQKMLQERWSYDDLDEDEDEEGEDGRNSTDQEDSIFQSRNPSYSIVNELFDHRNRSPSLDAVHTEFYDSESESVLNANNETLLSSPDVIFRDDQIANAELVEYFFDVASKGGNINLKSVCGEFKEDVL